MTSEKLSAEMHFIVQNVSKKHNIGTICRNCTAFDVKSMHLVGSAHYNVFGSQGSDAHVRIEHHPTLEECRETMKETYKCEEILGVEITEESVDVAKYPWKGNTAFVLGEWNFVDVVVAFLSIMSFSLFLSLPLSFIPLRGILPMIDVLVLDSRRRKQVTKATG